MVVSEGRRGGKKTTRREEEEEEEEKKEGHSVNGYQDQTVNIAFSLSLFCLFDFLSFFLTPHLRLKTESFALHMLACAHAYWGIRPPVRVCAYRGGNLEKKS